MAALPYIQLYVADYLADTAHLSTVEHGAYLLLIFNYWQRGESFKAKDENSLNRRLASVARMSIDDWSAVKESIAEFFDTSETEWISGRIERDLLAVNSKSDKARAAGSDRARPLSHIWREIRSRIFMRDDYTCQYCGERGKKLECDHVVPVSKGGEHSDDNLVTACFACNRSKRDKLVCEWGGR